MSEELNLELFKSESKIPGVNDFNTGIPELDMSVIGIMSGTFMEVTMSSNKRDYTAEFLEKITKSKQVLNRLKNGLMNGTFEHPTHRSFFTKEGGISNKHAINSAFVVKELKFNKKTGKVFGRAYILNTPMGRLLAMYLRAEDKNGDKLFNVGISVRGFTREDHIDSRGVDVMQHDDYFMEAFDATLTPGMSIARPKLESDDYDEVAHEAIELIDQYCNSSANELCNIECHVQNLKKELNIS